MRVSQVVPRISAEASGPSYSVPRLCEALASTGTEVQLHVLDDVPQKRWNCPIYGYPSWSLARSLGVSPRMRLGLRETASRTDVLHSHSLWMMPNIYPGRAVRRSQCRLVISPRGTMSPWALKRSWLRKRLIWALGQGTTVARADCLHATAQSEFEDIRRLGLTKPVAVIPNGVDIPDLQEHERRADGRRRLLFLARIHPKKGLDVLLRSWAHLQSRFPDWELHVVGPDNGWAARMQQLAQSLELKRVHFPGPAFGERKSDAFRSAELYVLPSHSENFGISVAEALAHGVPAVVTQGAPWQGLEINRCGWWIEPGEAPLTECLQDAMALPPEELAAHGRRGRAWMQRDFSWDAIGRMMRETYEWLLVGKAPPPWVRMD